MALSSPIAIALLVGCGAAPLPASSVPRSGQPDASITAGIKAHPELPIADVAAPVPPVAPAPEPASEDPSGPARLEKGVRSMPVPAGRSLVDVASDPGTFVSIGVLGKSTVLLGFAIIDPPSVRAMAAHGALDEDGILPKIVSFRAPLGVSDVTVLIDVAEPVELARTEIHPSVLPPEVLSLKPPKKLPVLPLIGLPAPSSRDDGYIVQSPSRYQFIRIDAAASLLAAFRQTRIRFRRDPIAVADISQWDGQRPATDLGKPRHISHEGGRDIDIALPAADGLPSIVRAHCDGVLIEADNQGCAPGTARGFDALRAAYFLGLLLDGPPPSHIERIFTDDAFVREIRQAAEVLRKRRWIKDDGFAGLLDDTLLRPSPWHVDHMHIRFSGQPGLTPFQ